jgi:nuclear transport factor 2 (NTF2) superfamily protein
MSQPDALIERFVASWNDPDPATRRRVIDEICAPDCVYRNVRAEFSGRDGVAEAVTAAHEAYVDNGFVFRLVSLDTNHDAVRYRWEMVPAAGGEPDSIGTHIAMLGPDGRLTSDHQFIDKPPSGR